QSLLRTEAMPRSHKHADFELFDYPALLAEPTDSESSRIARLRIEEQQTGQVQARGRGNAIGLANGCRFKLIRHPRDDFNIEYLITAQEVRMRADGYDTGTDADQVEVSVSLQAIDARTAFRPARTTPRPVVPGTQTAVVVGPPGE